MNAPLRKAGVVVLVMFGLLFANMNWVQAYKADEYRTDARNRRVTVAEYERARGTIEADGEPLAESKPTDGVLKFQRSYPGKQVYAPIIGYKPVDNAEVGIERSEDEFLAGESDKLIADRLSDMFTGDNTSGGNIVLTVNTRAQETAWKQLTQNQKGATKGAAVALDPRSGAIQAMVSMPSYDPNPLVNHDNKLATAAFNKLNKDPDQPLVNRAVAATLPPGSTMKVLISAAALQAGKTPESVMTAGDSYTPPGTTRAIGNAAGQICPGAKITIKQALTDSCNTGFARLGVELGGEQVRKTVEAFGFGQNDLTVGNLENNTGLKVSASELGTMANADGTVDQAALAQSSIGQRDVRMTPLMGAMVAATVANGGKQMRPYLVQQLLNSERRSIYTANGKVLRTPIDESVATDLREMMVSVVENGTGTRAKIKGFEVGGKTGTAQNAEGAADHGWFVGFAFNEKGVPVSAVCVMLQNTEGGSSEATRIAGAIMRAVAGKGGD